MTYHQIKALVEGTRGKKKKWKGNTYLVATEEGVYAAQFWGTNIVTFYPDGRIQLNTKGWMTATSKERINDISPINISQEGHVWYMSVANDDINKRIFRDGVIIQEKDGKYYAIENSDGIVGITDTVENINKTKRNIETYVKAFVDAVYTGTIDAPSQGDCWFCLFKDKNGKPMGEGDPGHILAHIDESYFVPSLLVNALHAFPQSAACHEWVHKRMNGPVQHDLRNQFRERSTLEEQLHKVLRRYIYKQIGFAS